MAGYGNNNLFGPGVVGGPKGTGAQLLRVLVQYATEYDRGNLEQLTTDLKQLQQYSEANAKVQVQNLQKQSTLQTQLNQAQAARRQLTDSDLIALKNYTAAQQKSADLFTLAGKVDSQARTEQLAAARAYYAQVESTGVLTREQAELVLNQATYAEQLAAAERQVNLARQAGVSLLEEQAAASKEVGAGGVAGGKPISQQLGGLALGAVGGTVGGFLLANLAFGPVQAALDGIKKGVVDLIDPANEARDALKGVASQVEEIASSQHISNLEAAQRIISGIGGGLGRTLPGGATGGLALAGQTEDLKNALDQLDSIAKQGRSAEELWNEQRERGVDLLFRQSDAAKILLDNADHIRQVMGPRFDFGLFSNPATIDKAVEAGAITVAQGEALHKAVEAADTAMDSFADHASDSAQALQEATDAANALTEKFGGQALDESLAHYTTGITDAVKVTTDALKQANDTHIRNLRTEEQATITTIQRTSDARIRALEQQAQRLDNGDTRSGRTKGLQAQLNALSTQGPSQAVRDLTAALDGLQKKQAEILAQRKAIDDAEKIDLLQLQARLEKAGVLADIEKYSGKERITAINANLDLLQKQVQQQQTLNALLTAQANIAKGITRNTGESIQDFLTRRAEFYRAQLTDAAKAQADQQTAALNAEKDNLQTLTDLHDAEVKQQQDREDALYAAREKRLQKELAAQQKADQIALTKRRQVLEEELRASQKADANALEAQRQEIQNEIADERKKAATKIAIQRHNYDDAVKIFQNQTDAAVDAANKQRDAEIQAEKDRVQAVKNLLSQSTTDQQALALHQAHTLAEIMTDAGGLAGAGYSAALLRAQGQALGLSDYQITYLIAQADKVHTQYQDALDRLTSKAQYYGNSDFGGNGGPHAKGFVFPLGNQHASTPFGQDIRHGEQGEEMGVILSHKVTQALRDTQQSQPLFGGNFIYNSRGNERREAQRVRRAVEGVVDDKLAGRRPTASRLD